jgi:hypothetical protein
MDDGDFSPTCLVNELQCHFHAVLVGFVEEEFARAIQVVRRVEGLGRLGVRYLLDADDDIHAT